MRNYIQKRATKNIIQKNLCCINNSRCRIRNGSNIFNRGRNHPSTGSQIDKPSITFVRKHSSIKRGHLLKSRLHPNARGNRLGRYFAWKLNRKNNLYQKHRQHPDNIEHDSHRLDSYKCLWTINPNLEQRRRKTEQK